MKLVELTTKHIQENQDVYERIEEWRDVDKAEGKVLDMHGRDVRQNRGQLSDNVYRVLIKSKIKRGLSDGSIDTIIDFMSFILQVDPEEIEVNELWSEGKPAVLDIKAPVAPIANTGLTVKQFGTLVDLVVAGGVRAESQFQGTFEFAAGPGETGPDGFADSAQTTGGTLGVLYDPGTDFELPL